MEAQEGSDPLDRQVGGWHYSKGGIQPIHFTETNKLTFSEGNVVKYITRYRDKNGLQDLQKVEHYLEFVEKYSETGRRISAKNTIEFVKSNNFNCYQEDILEKMLNYLLYGDVRLLSMAKIQLRELMKEYEH